MKKHAKNFKFFRKELIPQTKASAVVKSKNSMAELRISGFMKDFTLRDLHITYKDSADITDM